MEYRQNMRQKLVVCLWIAILGSESRCSNSNDGDNEKKQCPASGIGVKSTSGVSCREAGEDITSAAWKDCQNQWENYKNYDCAKPQICSDLTHVVLYHPIDEKAPRENVPFIITNCSAGQEKLIIQKIELFGNSRCSFSEPELGEAESGQLANEIMPGKYVALRTTYNPKTPGEDHIMIRITSNAANYNPFSISICGQAKTKAEVDAANPGAAAEDGGSADASSTIWTLNTCLDVGEEKTSCPTTTPAP